MRRNRVLALGASLLVLLSACTTGGGSSPSASSGGTTGQSASPPASAGNESASPPASAGGESTAPSGGPLEAPTVRIGSDDFYESKLMAEIYAQVLENAGVEVDRKFGLGARQARQPALESGQIDLVPEYVGSGLGFYDKSKITGDGEENRTALQVILTDKGGGITVFGITPGEDTNAFVVRQDTATELNLAKMSDLAAVQDDIKWGLPPDCDANPLCKDALEEYGITYPPKQREALAACDVPIAEALNGGAIDLAELCSTQPAISQFGFVVLEDDKDTQPAENIAPLVRDDYLAKVSDAAAFQQVLDDASAKMTTEELTALGVKVAVDNEDVEDVAAQWLQDQGLLP
ncbi:MAG: ABC transporter substrate-binding protein [Chloroflexi bacterium]|nr:ABC transporter substrate-binding protein [Chloroflexota bacterium]